MNLSELQPAAGSKHNDNFRRGRGHGSGNGKTAGKKAIRDRKPVQELQESALKVVRCHYTEEYQREVSPIETPLRLWESMWMLSTDSK